MSLMVIGRGTLPVSTRGKAGTISVAVRENGQIGFSTLAGKVFDNNTHCKIDWDSDERQMIFTPANAAKPPKGVKAEDLFVVGNSKDGARYISAAGLFQHEAVAYDYKAAGTHSFPAEIDNGKLTYTLPVKMEPKVRKPRTPKAKGASAGTAPASGNGAPELEEA